MFIGLTFVHECTKAEVQQAAHNVAITCGARCVVIGHSHRGNGAVRQLNVQIDSIQAVVSPD